MKLLILSTLLTSLAFAKGVQDFNGALLKDVQKDIAKDNDSFRRKEPVRRPASVDHREIRDESKLEKSIRQIGPRSW